jgi:hypothetical protein
MRKPTPDQVADALADLAPDGDTRPIAVLVAKLQQSYGCSRATAYRAVSDALAAAAIGWSQT